MKTDGQCVNFVMREAAFENLHVDTPSFITL